MSEANEISEDDAGDKVQMIQERIQRLRTEHQNRLNETVQNAMEALQEVQKRVETAKKTQQSRNVKENERLIEELIASLKKRKNIERQMFGAAVDTDERMKELEVIIEAGYTGRTRDATKQLRLARGGDERDNISPEEKKPTQEDQTYVIRGPKPQDRRKGGQKKRP
ncbi:hypothetical protein CC79DRAFT_1364842 [Sarocladium strictum]